MRMPEIAQRIREISFEIESDFEEQAEELRRLADNMRRRQSSGRAPATSTSISDELKSEIREYKKSNPHMSQQQVAEHFNVNHGRVSEAVSGKRR